ncbi:stonustoxin subunit alpha-like [Ornithorhynchus anatinus]|nr:stonustoxin subunit alpha-like [Ornithorhynchus anatinus]XP_039769922.1 stonustoxin subunit alpha-like [Ornithorhynchus anatinus]XP_039769923.1 stonustoxin subunit alpha-like [Ornithorhynchus anatinus]
MDLKPIEMPTLGRPLQLGMLYDCRDDSFVPGFTLWNINDTEKDMHSQAQHRTEFQVIASDSLEDKSSALNVHASLKASFMAGLVEVGGSASYMDDTKKSKHQARVTLHYSTTTHFKQLTMKHLGWQNVMYPEVFEQGTATHVVTGILFGAQAFFVFDREFSSSENEQDIQGSLSISIRKIPMVSIEGEGTLQMKDEEKKKVEKFNCTFYGDFALEKNPITYTEAVKVYSSLPRLLGANGEKAVPLRVWLYPLAKLDSKAARLVREISSMLVSDAQAVLEGLTDCFIRCNDMLATKAAKFPAVGEKIKRFRELCQKFKHRFQKDLSVTLPKIRGGGAGEEILANVLTARGDSPFNQTSLNQFLDRSEAEINFIDSYLSLLDRVDIVSSENKRAQMICDPQIDVLVSFTLTSIEKEDPYLSELDRWLRNKKVEEAEQTDSAHEGVNSSLWFKQDEIQGRLRKLVVAFSKFAEGNESQSKIRFIVAAVSDKNNPGASIYLHIEGVLASRNFEPPACPPFPQIEAIRSNRIQLRLSTAGGGREGVKSYCVEYRSGDSKWTSMIVDGKQEKIEINNLKYDTNYEFRFADVYESWRSQRINKRVTTLPIGPPEDFSAALRGRETVSLSWKCPKENVNMVTGYKVEYRQEAEGANEAEESDWQKLMTGKDTEIYTINELGREKFYRFRVSAVCGAKGAGDPSKECPILTKGTGVTRKAFPIPTKREKETLTLDPETANEYLCLSWDKKSVEWIIPPQKVSQNHKRFVGEAYVLGSTGFNSGQHYWEVEVEGKGLCKIGVAAESVERKSNQAHQETIWSLTICTPYHVLIDNEPHRNIEVPCIVGVLLDFPGGQVTFFNAETQQEIHAYRTSFKEKIFPFLGFLGLGSRLTLRP